MPRLLIPNDWDGNSREVWLICAPASPMWRQALRTAVGALHRGRTWDASSGNIVGAQSIGWEIYDDMTTCSELITAVNAIAAAVSQLQQTTIVNGVCCEQITPPADPPAIDPNDYPLPGSGGHPPTLPDAPTYDAAMCDAANGVLWLFRRYAQTVLVGDILISGAAAIVALLAALFPEPITTAIGTVSLVALAAALAGALVYADAMEDGANAFISWLDANKTAVVCDALAAAAGGRTFVMETVSALAAEMESALLLAGVPAVVATRAARLIADAGLFAEVVLDSLADAAARLTQPPSSWRVDCASCYATTSWQFTDDLADDDAWTGKVRIYPETPQGNRVWKMSASSSTASQAAIDQGQMVAQAGLSGSYLENVTVSMRVIRWANHPGPDGRSLQIRWDDETGSPRTLDTLNTTLTMGDSDDVLSEPVRDFVLTHPVRVTGVPGQRLVDIRISGDWSIYVDDITVAGDVVQ